MPPLTDRDRVHKAIKVLIGEISTEIGNLERIYDSSAQALDTFRRHFRLLVGITVVIPFVAGAAALLTKVLPEWETALVLIAGLLNLGLGTAQLAWAAYGYNRQAAQHKHICDRAQGALTRIQKELPSDEQLDLLTDAQLGAMRNDVLKLRNYAVDEAQACRSAAAGTIITLMSELPKTK